MNFIMYIVTAFFLLSVINLFPYFRQTKKNLMWLVFIFIVVSVFMITDLGLEFIPLAYLLIYVGAVAVMFLFIIVTVDPKLENQKDTFELTVFPALAINNFLTAIMYFLMGCLSGNNPAAITKFVEFVSYLDRFRIKGFKISNLAVGGRGHNIGVTHFTREVSYIDNLSLYSILEYRTKDIYVFAEYFYTQHSFLLIMVGFILTIAMVVSIVIAKDFNAPYKNLLNGACMNLK